jgi:hypothetical protein
MKWLCLLVAIISEVVATSALKASQGFTRLGPSLLVVAGYGAAFYFLSLIPQDDQHRSRWAASLLIKPASQPSIIEGNA